MLRYRRPGSPQYVQFKGLILGRQIPRGCLDVEGRYGIRTFVTRTCSDESGFRLPVNLPCGDAEKERFELVYPILEPRQFNYDLLKVLKPPNVINSIGMDVCFVKISCLFKNLNLTFIEQYMRFHVFFPFCNRHRE